MSELLKINVNGHTERKGNLTYLSWAWAWAEVLKVDPGAQWTAHEWDNSPVMYLRNGTAMVKVSVEIKGDIKTCILPVMDNRNRAIVDPDAFAVNSAIMRCLTKAIAMHGLGLYIYAGEDLPESEKAEPSPEVLAQIASVTDAAALVTLFKSLDPAIRAAHMDAFSARKKKLSDGGAA
jgi:hypothetical protein